eukprot:4013205-Alexandrium_andersonii.AAC.1
MVRTCPGSRSRPVFESTALPVRLGRSLRPHKTITLANALQRSYGYAAAALVLKDPAGAARSADTWHGVRRSRRRSRRHTWAWPRPLRAGTGRS